MEPYSNLGHTQNDTIEGVESDSDISSRFSEQEVSDGMDGARYSYLFNFLGLPFSLIPLFGRENSFSLFHAKQAILVWALFFGSLFISWSLCWITLKAMWIFVLGGGASLTLNVMGYQRVMNESDEPLPLLGRLSENWFSNLRVREDEADVEI